MYETIKGLCYVACAHICFLSCIFLFMPSLYYLFNSQDFEFTLLCLASILYSISTQPGYISSTIKHGKEEKYIYRKVLVSSVAHTCTRACIIHKQETGRRVTLTTPI